MIARAARRLYEAMERRDADLLYLFFEVTRRCDLSCLHCGSDCSSAPVSGLGRDDWTRFARNLPGKFSPEPFVVMTGGEPLLLPWLEDLGDTLRSGGIGWGFVTNGQSLTPSRAASLAEAGALSATVSLDGLEASHDRLRGKSGAWKAGLAAVSAAREAGMRTDVVTCVHGGNFPELDRLSGVMKEIKPDSWRLFRIMKKGRAASRPELTMGAGEFLPVLEWIARKRPEMMAAGIDLMASCDGWMPWKLDRSVRPEPFFCRSGINIASILSDGSINGCSNNDPSLAQGSILSEDFSEVWRNRFKPFRERSWLRRGLCEDCPHWRGCAGGSMHGRTADDSGPIACWRI